MSHSRLRWGLKFSISVKIQPSTHPQSRGARHAYTNNKPQNTRPSASVKTSWKNKTKSCQRIACLPMLIWRRTACARLINSDRDLLVCVCAIYEQGNSNQLSKIEIKIFTHDSPARATGFRYHFLGHYHRALVCDEAAVVSHLVPSGAVH